MSSWISPREVRFLMFPTSSIVSVLTLPVSHQIKANMILRVRHIALFRAKCGKAHFITDQFSEQSTSHGAFIWSRTFRVCLGGEKIRRYPELCVYPKVPFLMIFCLFLLQPSYQVVSNLMHHNFVLILVTEPVVWHSFESVCVPTDSEFR